MEIRTVTAGQGWQWIKRGVALFQKSPLRWWLYVSVLFVSLKVVLLIPLLGLVVMLTIPALLVGLMEACRALDYGKPLAFGYLLSGFVRNTTALITLGGISLAGNMLVLLVISGIGGDAIVEVMKFTAQNKVTPENSHEIREAASQATLAGLIGWALSIPLLMALWFAPLLAYFNNMKPLRAMMYSFAACWRNMPAFLLYGAVLFAALMLVTPFAMATRTLDLGLWMLAPIVIPTIYAGYRDIFDIDAAADADGTPPVESSDG
jgi:hypothetical protein